MQGRGQCLYCLTSIGSQCRISVAVLVNNCFLWQSSRAASTVPICSEAESNQAVNMEKEPKSPGEDVTL